jgi:hypothetical protein
VAPNKQMQQELQKSWHFNINYGSFELIPTQQLATKKGCCDSMKMFLMFFFYGVQVANKIYRWREIDHHLCLISRTRLRPKTKICDNVMGKLLSFDVIIIFGNER